MDLSECTVVQKVYVVIDFMLIQRLVAKISLKIDINMKSICDKKLCIF